MPETAADMPNDGMGEIHEPLRQPPSVHEFAGENEKGDSSERETVGRVHNPLREYNDGNIGEQENGQDRQPDRETNRNPNRDQEQEHDKHDNGVHG